jgi:hypothetical protein
MNHFDRKRRHVVTGADLLESRTLLNAHVPHSPIADVASIHIDTKAPKPITGTLTGMLSFPRVPLTNPHAFFVTWSATGNSTVGPAAVKASFLGTTVEKGNANIARISYTGGSGTLTLGNGSTLALTFTGSRQTRLGQPNKPAPPVTYKFNGTAMVESGPNKGHVDKFTASDTEPNNPLILTVRFTLK